MTQASIEKDNPLRIFRTKIWKDAEAEANRATQKIGEDYGTIKMVNFGASKFGIGDVSHKIYCAQLLKRIQRYFSFVCL